MGFWDWLGGKDDDYRTDIRNMTNDELVEAKKLNQEWLAESKKYGFSNQTYHQDTINLIDRLLDNTNEEGKKEGGWKFW